jgi:hypothetical protein
MTLFIFALACFLQSILAKLMKNEKAKVKDDKEQPRHVSTCFEGLSGAEMMQKLMGEEGIGSLCDEMLRSSMNRNQGAKDESQESGKEEGHGREE